MGGAFATTYTVDPVGTITKTTFPDNSTLAYSYYASRELVNVKDALGNQIAITPDGMNDPTQVQLLDSSGTASKSHTATFDGLGRRLTDVGGQGQATTYTYDKNGNELTVKDGLGNETARAFDALNRLSSSTDANGGVVTYTYDAHDRLLSITDQNGNTTAYVYDGFGDVIQQTSPDSGTTILHYDKDGNVTSKTDALGIITSQTFDALDRPLTTTYPADASENIAYTYDQMASGFSFGVGRLTGVTDAAGSLTRAYDERGNLLTEQRISGSATLTTAYTYDPRAASPP